MPFEKATYEWRRGLVIRTHPHAGHFAIAKLAKSLSRSNAGAVEMTLITQNVDDLHEPAGF
ncbi:MAG: hypothetical protein K9J77_10540 [Rhodoferax sp.]|nr:hypothetical protein [Rhodoferax sp.]